MPESLFPPKVPMASHAIEVDHANFMQDVIEASTTTPVMVEFWSSASALCQKLSPRLANAVQALEGRITLARLNIDTNRPLVTQLAQMGLPLQSVPLVVAFWQGQVCDLFQGTPTDPQLKTFLETLLKDSGQSLPAAHLLEKAKEALQTGAWAKATNHYTSLLETDPNHPAAWAGLIRCMMGLDDPDSAEEAARQIPESLLTDPLICEVKTALHTFLEGKKAAGKLSQLRQAVAQSPKDTTLLAELATALNGAGQREEAAQLLLDIIAHDKEEARQTAKAQLLTFFESWGMTHPDTLTARRKLSSLLFS